jgi:hypothetical protein
MIAKLISGGQTGVDRAALDVALERGLPCGGWCPLGWRAEDGVIPDRYPLQETPTPAYPQRTEWNVRDADGTLVFTRGRPRGGTALTIELAGRLHKPLLIVDLNKPPLPIVVHTWAQDHHVRVLNVAGPRESESPGIYVQAGGFLRAVFDAAIPLPPSSADT